jgi:glycosyltransferase involved in cell wall biosynthesis
MRETRIASDLYPGIGKKSNSQVEFSSVPAIRTNDVYLVGPRHHHHSGHSGYENFRRYVGVPLESPVKVRTFAGRLGYYRRMGDLGSRLDQAITALTRRPYYSFGIFLIELWAGLHMAFHRRSLYHALYGDTDVWLLGYFRRVTGTRLVATFHEPLPQLEWFQLDRIVPNLDAAILVSESQRPYFEKLLPAERIFVHPHGVDTDFFKPVGNATADPVCITVGAHLRDFETLSAVMTLVREKNPNVRFIAVGARREGGGNSRLDDERFIHLEHLSDEQLRDAYQSARVAVFSFRDATASNALLEAMATGLPTVATDVGGVRECVSDETGILCPPRDPHAMAEAIVKLLTDRECADRMSTASRLRAVRFDYKEVAKTLGDIYSRIANQRNGHKAP